MFLVNKKQQWKGHKNFSSTNTSSHKTYRPNLAFFFKITLLSSKTRGPFRIKKIKWKKPNKQKGNYINMITSNVALLPASFKFAIREQQALIMFTYISASVLMWLDMKRSISTAALFLEFHFQSSIKSVSCLFEDDSVERQHSNAFLCSPFSVPPTHNLQTRHFVGWYCRWLWPHYRQPLENCGIVSSQLAIPGFPFGVILAWKSSLLSHSSSTVSSPTSS